jgi:hypothetical protein
MTDQASNRAYSDLTRKQLSTLRDILVTYFDRDGLRTLCFDLEIEYEDLPDTLSGMARELVRVCVLSLASICGMMGVSAGAMSSQPTP